MSRIELSNQEDIQAHQRQKKAQIFDAFNKTVESNREARLITKAEMEEDYPLDQFEYYPLSAIHKFRQEILKADDVEDKDGAFKEATAGLQSFVVQNGKEQSIVFVRRKEAGGEEE